MTSMKPNFPLTFWHNFTNSTFRFPSTPSPSWISRSDKYLFLPVNVSFNQLQFRKTWGAIPKWKESSRAYEQAKETSSDQFQSALGRSTSLPASKSPSTTSTNQQFSFFVAVIVGAESDFTRSFCCWVKPKTNIAILCHKNAMSLLFTSLKLFMRLLKNKDIRDSLSSMPTKHP